MWCSSPVLCHVWPGWRALERLGNKWGRGASRLELYTPVPLHAEDSWHTLVLRQAHQRSKVTERWGCSKNLPVPSTCLTCLPLCAQPSLLARISAQRQKDIQLSDVCTRAYSCRRVGGRGRQMHSQRKSEIHTKEPIIESVSHGPMALLSWPHVLTTCIDHICWPEVLLAWGSQTVLPHWNGLADSRPNSLVWCYPAWLPSCLEHCRCHLTSGYWECVVKGDTSAIADPGFKIILTIHNRPLWW